MCKLMVIMGKTNMGACTHHTGWGLRERERRQGEEKRRKEMEAKERRGEEKLSPVAHVCHCAELCDNALHFTLH